MTSCESLLTIPELLAKIISAIYQIQPAFPLSGEMHLNVMELEFDDQEQVDNKEFELEFLALTIDKTTLG